MDANGIWYSLMGSESSAPPKILIIGAGSRGNSYAEAITESTKAVVAAVAEPIKLKRKELGQKYIWGKETAAPGQEFKDWKDFLTYEELRRKSAAAGNKVEDGVDAAFVCTLDEQHAEIIIGLAPLKLHVMSEKPLAPRLADCLKICAALKSDDVEPKAQTVFSIGHVLRYSPHNMMLRKLLLEDDVVGDVMSMEHTEPVGWWHFSHSYVRGNWRKESTSAPSLLTKSCHDVDFILWLMCHSPRERQDLAPHLPSKISSSGSLNFFRKSRKPRQAGNATNCLSCPHESSCMYSAKKIYIERHLKKRQNTGWPLKIVNPEIENCYITQGPEAAEKKLYESLREDYNVETDPVKEIEQRPWFGRCVWESDNDVCDDQWVSFTWDEEEAVPIPTSKRRNSLQFGAKSFLRPGKTATFHMVAHTEAICERRGRIYGERGEVSYDSETITVTDFTTGLSKTYHPVQHGGGHGGGDRGLTQQFIGAVEAVKSGNMTVEEAQRIYIGCDLDEVLRSHAAVFAAEEARKEGKVVDWKEWWTREVDSWQLIDDDTL